MKNILPSLILPFVAAFCILQFFSCTTEIAPPPPPLYCSSSVEDVDISSSSLSLSSSILFASSSSSLIASSSSLVMSSSSSSVVASSSSLVMSSSSSSVVASSSSLAISSSSVVVSSSSIFSTNNTFIDSRDGNVYKKVTIGANTWMAENLNYNANGSKCHNNIEANCAIYGRLYDWSTALLACPSGWRLPSDTDWNTLITTVGSSTAGMKLKAINGWYKCGTSSSGSSNVCEDTYGFSALPGGYGIPSNLFYDIEVVGDWWSSSEDGEDSSRAIGRGMKNDYDGIVNVKSTKSILYSVRCLQD